MAAPAPDREEHALQEEAEEPQGREGSVDPAASARARSGVSAAPCLRTTRTSSRCDRGRAAAALRRFDMELPWRRDGEEDDEQMLAEAKGRGSLRYGQRSARRGAGEIVQDEFDE